MSIHSKIDLTAHLGLKKPSARSTRSSFRQIKGMNMPNGSNPSSRWVCLFLLTNRSWIISKICVRDAKEFLPYRASTSEFGELRLATVTTPKSWGWYGIHALETVYPTLGRLAGDRDLKDVIVFPASDASACVKE